MFGYIPTGRFDLTDEETEGVPLVRTKQRAYMIAVWAGPWGAHQFFLGNTLGGLAHWLVLGTLVGFPSSMGFWTGFPLALLLNIGTWLLPYIPWPPWIKMTRGFGARHLHNMLIVCSGSARCRCGVLIFGRSTERPSRGIWHRTGPSFVYSLSFSTLKSKHTIVFSYSENCQIRDGWLGR